MTRPRGFIQQYNPQPDRQILITNIQTVLNENEDILPLTIRQIFYMLVSNYGFDKDEKSYKRLTETISLARRAGLIAMDTIRDDGFLIEEAEGWQDKESMLRAFQNSAENFRLNRQDGQPVHLMVWCEAKGMVPQLSKTVNDFGVNVYSSGGFDSLTAKHSMAYTISQYEAVEILHIGDHDPSGVHLASSLFEDLDAFCMHYGGSVKLTRLAVTPGQIEAMNLPTAPPKKTDRRKFEGWTTQAEAIPPRVLREIVIMGVRSRLDMEIFNDTLLIERDDRAAVTEIVEKIAGAAGA